MLEEADHEHAVVAGQDVFCAIAMVHVEIHHRHALEPSHIERMAGSHSHVVEEAKTHGLVVGGMVAGRANGAEGVVQLAIDHGIGRGNGRTSRPPGRRPRGRTGPGVRIKRTGFARGFQVLEEVIERQHIVEIVCQRQVGVAGQRHVGRQHQHVQADRAQVVFNGLDALRTLGVTGPHIVSQTIGV